LLLTAVKMTKVKVEVIKELSFKDLGNLAIVNIKGAIFFANCYTVVEKLKRLNSQYDKLIVVMKDIEYLDFSAAQTMLETLKNSQSEKRVVFTDTNATVMKVLKASGV